MTVHAALAVAGLAAGAFLATGVDNLLLVTFFLATTRRRKIEVKAAYLASLLLLVGAAYGISHAARFAPGELLRYLGLVPILMGSWNLVQAIRGVRDDAPSDASKSQMGGAEKFLVVLGVMLANGGDSLAVFGSAFADTAVDPALVMSGVILGLGIIMVLLASWLTERPAVTDRLQRWGTWVLPIVLIGVGTVILLDTGFDKFEAPGVGQKNTRASR